jgi:DNA-binding GntR family transcriptional regulator
VQQKGLKISVKSDLLEPIIAENLSQLAFERLEGLIMAGEIEPGTKISEAKLARRLGISRGPLREAIGRLEGLGIVTRVTNQGPRVTSLSKEELLELFVVREAIEGMASRHAAMNASEADLVQLEKLLSQHEKDPAVKGGRGYFQGRGDLDFHLQITKASRNSRLYAFVSGPLFSVLRLYRRRFSIVPGRSLHALAEHKAILAAIRKRDPDAAEAAMRHHIRQSRENVLLALGMAAPAPDTRRGSKKVSGIAVLAPGDPRAAPRAKRV